MAAERDGVGIITWIGPGTVRGLCRDDCGQGEDTSCLVSDFSISST